MLLQYHLILRALLKDTLVVQVPLPLQVFFLHLFYVSCIALPSPNHHSPSLCYNLTGNLTSASVMMSCLICFMCMTFACMRAFMCTTCMPSAQGIQKEDVGSPGNDTDSGEPPCGCWKQTPVPCKGSSALAAEPLQSFISLGQSFTVQPGFARRTRVPPDSVSLLLELTECSSTHCPTSLMRFSCIDVSFRHLPSRSLLMSPCDFVPLWHQG